MKKLSRQSIKSISRSRFHRRSRLVNATPAPELIDGDMYTFEALIKEVATTEAKPAPRKAAYDSTTAPSTRFVVFPFNLNGSSNITTSISEVNSSAQKAKTIHYFNTLGSKSTHSKASTS